LQRSFYIRFVSLTSLSLLALMVVLVGYIHALALDYVSSTPTPVVTVMALVLEVVELGLSLVVSPLTVLAFLAA